jgi:RNA polymerase sigma-70 factor (ECF subfamily)
MKEQLDENTLRAFTAGNQLAFKAVFNLFNKQLCYFCYKLTSNQQEAEDITSHTFIKLFERCAHISTEPNIKAFLYITARNKCLDYLRSGKKQRQRQEELTRSQEGQDADDPWHSLAEQHMMVSETLQQLYQAVEDLPDQRKAVFKALFYEQLKPNEVAKRLEITLEAVRSHKRYAIADLRRILHGNALSG